jgi:hypothetical protein
LEPFESRFWARINRGSPDARRTYHRKAGRMTARRARAEIRYLCAILALEMLAAGREEG